MSFLFRIFREELWLIPLKNQCNYFKINLFFIQIWNEIPSKKKIITKKGFGNFLNLWMFGYIPLKNIAKPIFFR